MYGSWIADVGQVDNRFPLSGMLWKFVGQTPGSARDALVPHLEQRGQRLAGYDRPTRASSPEGTPGPGGPPHHWRRRPFGKNEWHWADQPARQNAISASLPDGVTRPAELDSQTNYIVLTGG